MSNLAFLAAALIVSVLGSLLVWLRYRKPKTLMSSIQEFQREMGALGGAPEPRRTQRGATRPDPILPAPEQGDLARKLKDARLHRSTEPGGLPDDPER